MDFNIVTLEVFDLIRHFNYFDRLVTDLLKRETKDTSEEYAKINNKSKEHLERFFDGLDLYDGNEQLKDLWEIKGLISLKLENMKNKEIHELVEKLGKDARKMKKLYLLLTKK